METSQSLPFIPPPPPATEPGYFILTRSSSADDKSQILIPPSLVPTLKSLTILSLEIFSPAVPGDGGSGGDNNPACTECTVKIYKPIGGHLPRILPQVWPALLGSLGPGSAIVLLADISLCAACGDSARSETTTVTPAPAPAPAPTLVQAPTSVRYPALPPSWPLVKRRARARDRGPSDDIAPWLAARKRARGHGDAAPSSRSSEDGGDAAARAKGAGTILSPPPVLDLPKITVDDVHPGRPYPDCLRFKRLFTVTVNVVRAGSMATQQTVNFPPHRPLNALVDHIISIVDYNYWESTLELSLDGKDIIDPPDRIECWQALLWRTVEGGTKPITAYVKQRG
ncbi:hypothetical protein FGG08_002145 [Glutinoglossum americanum]|uniref:Uncharacterized protein n=1 Tax=Glutinoglossum americanum TaxID=1670608 RepID=A0A9P8L4S0_9PEZI|nr:hypothetical protein FGG08_002145 [Glutinoglossum americanum]